MKTFYNGMMVNLTIEKQFETIIWPAVSLLYLGLFITFLVMFVLIVLAASVRMAIDASFWKQLKDNVE